VFHPGGPIDALMHHLCQKKAQEWVQLRRASREWRSQLADAMTPQAA
jgi:hypothetical protein